MNLTTKTSHIITFRVEAFWNEEGGMGHDAFGEPVSELAQAVHLLEMARIASPHTGRLQGIEWIITADVKTTVT